MNDEQFEQLMRELRAIGCGLGIIIGLLLVKWAVYPTAMAVFS